MHNIWIKMLLTFTNYTSSSLWFCLYALAPTPNVKSVFGAGACRGNEDEERVQYTNTKKILLVLFFVCRLNIGIFSWWLLFCFCFFFHSRIKRNVTFGLPLLMLRETESKRNETIARLSGIGRTKSLAVDVYSLHLQVNLLPEEILLFFCFQSFHSRQSRQRRTTHQSLNPLLIRQLFVFCWKSWNEIWMRN